MKSQDYEARNLKGFEGDGFLKAEFEKLIEKHKVDTVVETGTYLGGTTKVLSEMVDNVLTVEINKDNFVRASNHLQDCENVKLYFGSSPAVMSNVLPKLTGKSLLCFLDAHWGNVCPLKDELKVIAENKIKPVIIIHDFVVPGKPEFGYDSYNGQAFTYEWLKADLDVVYGIGGYNYYYNDKAEGAMRGVLFCEPK